MKLTNQQLQEIRAAISYLSSVNRETSFPIFDLGFQTNMTLATVLVRTKAALSAKGQDQPASSEEIELDLPTIKASEVKCNGLAPPPEVLAMLAPIFV